MDASSVEFWDVDGVPLNSYCWAIKSIGGSRKSLPALRGDNSLHPQRPGRRFKPKQPDSKVITLAMWVAGVDPDTNLPSNNNQSVQWNDNWEMLQRLVWTPDREVSLTRRWLTNAASPTLVSATASAQIAGSMEPTMTGRTRADFAVDFLLADPFFYGGEVTVRVPVNSTVTVLNPGDSAVRHAEFDITFEGNSVNPILLNETNGVWMQVNTLIPLDTDVSVDVASFNAIRSTDGTSVASSIKQGGDRHWMRLEPGVNRMKLTGSGSGTAVISFRPPYV